MDDYIQPRIFFIPALSSCHRGEPGVFVSLSFRGQTLIYRFRPPMNQNQLAWIPAFAGTTPRGARMKKRARQLNLHTDLIPAFFLLLAPFLHVVVPANAGIQDFLIILIYLLWTI